MSVDDVERIIYKRNPFQKRVCHALAKNKRITAVFAGWRTGKTDYVALEHVIRRQAYRNGDVLHLIAANTYSQLVDSTLRVVFAKLDLLGIPHQPEQLPKSHHPFSLFIWNGEKWVEFLCRSMDNFDIVAGTTLGSVWLDEVWGTEKWTYELANSRLSDKNSKLLQLVLTTTTDEPTHWMYTDIVARLDANVSNEGLKPSDIIEVVYGTTFDNEKNLTDGYISSLMSTLDKQMFERFIRSKWVSLVQGKIFYNFSRVLHLRRCEYDASLSLFVSCDFNINPMSWSIWQQHGQELWCIDQIKMLGRADTETAARELRERYPKCTQFIFFGDATGKSGSTKSKYSDYEIIESVFKGVRFEFRIPESNPSIRDSANAVNARLLNARGEINVFFDKERCPDVYLSCENVSYKPGTHEKDDSIDKNEKTVFKTHFSDTVRYVVNSLFPILPKPIGRSY